ncbi:MAG: hypothetical protein RR533_04195 [Carnobacterium sp.]
MNATKKPIILFTLLLLCIAVSTLFVQNNFRLYKQPIVKITEEKLKDKKESVGSVNNKDTLFYQDLIGEIKNGDKKGELVLLESYLLLFKVEKELN